MLRFRVQSFGSNFRFAKACKCRRRCVPETMHDSSKAFSRNELPQLRGHLCRITRRRVTGIGVVSTIELPFGTLCFREDISTINEQASPGSSTSAYISIDFSA